MIWSLVIEHLGAILSGLGTLVLGAAAWFANGERNKRKAAEDRLDAIERDRKRNEQLEQMSPDERARLDHDWVRDGK